MTLTLKGEDDSFTEAAEMMLMAMYMLTNMASIEGKTPKDMMEEEAEGKETELMDDEWATGFMGMHTGGSAMVTGFGAMGKDEWTDTDAGWTGTQTLGDKEWTISATRPLSAKPALTEGDDAWHTVALMFPDENEAAGFGMIGPAFTATMVGGAATLAAGATLAATMLF